MRAPALLLSVVLLVSACSGSSPSDPTADLSPDSSAPDPRVLPIGKGDLPLTAQTYYSPLDFVPPLAVTVPAGWFSTHRGDDAFDLGRDGVIVVFDTPEGQTVAPALAELRAKLPSPTSVTGTLAGEPATGFEGTGGTGTLLTSPSGTISLDLAKGQRTRVLGADVDGVPLLAVVILPSGGQVPADVATLLSSTARG